MKAACTAPHPPGRSCPPRTAPSPASPGPVGLAQLGRPAAARRRREGRAARPSGQPAMEHGGPEPLPAAAHQVLGLRSAAAGRVRLGFPPACAGLVLASPGPSSGDVGRDGAAGSRGRRRRFWRVHRERSREASRAGGRL